MMEIERKILEIERSALLKKIRALRPAAKKIFEGLVRVKYFDFSDRRIFKARDLLRVREISPIGKAPYVEVVYKKYKGIKAGCKFFKECEFVLREKGAFAKMSDFFKSLGLNQAVYYEKKRTLFRYKNMAFEIDEHPKIPPFLEIEAPSPRDIDAAIKLLGLENLESSSETIEELLRRKYKKIRLNGLIFG